MLWQCRVDSVRPGPGNGGAKEWPWGPVRGSVAMYGTSWVQSVHELDGKLEHGD